MDSVGNHKFRYTTDGIYYFNRSTGLNILFDELTCKPEIISKAPRQVSIALTNICDLNCHHCYAPKSSHSLNNSLLTNWLMELDANGCTGVSFGGGEPTLYPDLISICNFVTRSTSMAVTLTTHGHNINKELVQDLRSNVNFIRISMDGIYETYESYRHRAFSELLDSIKMVSSAIPFGINYLVNRNTIDEIDEAIAIAEDLHCSEFLLLPEVSVNGAGGIDSQTKNGLMKWINSYKGRIPLTVSKVSSSGLPIADPFTSETGLLSYSHLDAKGFIKSSSFIDYGVKIGNEGIMHALEVLSIGKRR